jgi:cellulose synthase (UDP-forming)
MRYPFQAENPTTSTIKPSPTHYRVTYQPIAGLATMRWLVATGMACMFFFLWWFFTTLRIGYAPLFWLLAISLGFKLLRMLHEWVHYVQVRVPVPPAPAAAIRRVDVLTTACPGEPHGMIIKTLEAMQAIRHPHTSYLCDEGNDPVLRAACARLGVVHVTRVLKKDAKAGNINNALRQATGEICVVLDPDHVPTPDFLDQVLPYFDDERVGFVQVVQAYGNQQESLVARGAAEQTYHFYGPLMMGMNGYGTVQAIGANCTFRRAALDSIGGHAAGLTEDMHTAMRLHAAGWQSVYVPKVVSRGLVPASLAAYYSQQLKWSRGAFDLLFRVYPRLFGKFTWAQRLHYLLLPLYFFSGVIALIDLALPVLSLGLSQFPWLVGLDALALHALPMLGMSLLIRCYVQRWLREPGESGLHLAGGFLRIGTWWVYTLGFVYAVLGVRVPYLPTPKEGRRDNEWLLALPNLLLAVLLLMACKYGRVTAYSFYTNTMVVLALVNVAILVAAAALGQHEATRNFIQDMAAWPFRGVVLRMHRLQAMLALALVPRLRRFSQPVAVASLVIVGISYHIRADWVARDIPEWLLTNTQSMHIGQDINSTEAGMVGTFAALSLTKPLAADCDIAALHVELPTASSQLPALVSDLASQQKVPLLSWPVSTTTSQQPSYWHHMARQLREVPGPVMLRPLLSAPTALSYRRTWRQMVEIFRREGVRNVVWVWSPEATDSLLQRFPGVAYTDWVAGSLLNGQGPPYGTLRPQMAQNLAFHQLPVLLLAPPQNSTSADVARLGWQYPEIKAVVFAAPTHTPNSHGQSG